MKSKNLSRNKGFMIWELGWPGDTHEAQVPFALGWAVPALIGITYPSTWPIVLAASFHGPNPKPEKCFPKINLRPLCTRYQQRHERIFYWLWTILRLHERRGRWLGGGGSIGSRLCCSRRTQSNCNSSSPTQTIKSEILLTTSHRATQSRFRNWSSKDMTILLTDLAIIKD